MPHSLNFGKLIQLDTSRVKTDNRYKNRCQTVKEKLKDKYPTADVFMFKLDQDPTIYIAWNTPREKDSVVLKQIMEDADNQFQASFKPESTCQQHQQSYDDAFQYADGLRRKFVDERRYRMDSIDVEQAAQEGVDPETAFFGPGN